MAIAVRLPDEMVNEAQKYAGISCRSTPKQIEYWYKIGKIAEENPDMSFEFIKGILQAMQEESIPFEFSHINKE